MENSHAKNLIEFGYSKIEISESESLTNDIHNLFYSICDYLIIILKESDEKYFKKDIIQFQNKLSNKNLDEIEDCLNNLITKISKKNRKLLSYLYDMGTRPMNFYYGKKLLTNNFIENINLNFFQNRTKEKHNPLIVCPYNGETLHIFPPGETKYNLPVHQDFPYLLQSRCQLTYWLNLSFSPLNNTGGIRIFSKSNSLKNIEHKKNSNGVYEITNYENISSFEQITSNGVLFELYAVDSTTLHQSILNESLDKSRLTYIFRYSDISLKKYRVPFGKDTRDGFNYEKLINNIP